LSVEALYIFIIAAETPKTINWLHRVLKIFFENYAAFGKKEGHAKPGGRKTASV